MTPDAEAMFADIFPKRRPEHHKGDFGRALVIAGCRGMSGAAVLAASAALRSGAGLVTAAVPECVWPIVAAANPCLMTLPLPDRDGRLYPPSLSSLQPELEKADVVALGPGLGQSDGVRELVRELVAMCSLPMVVDADALNALGHPPNALLDAKGPRVLTPHPGEFARLTGTTTDDVQSRRDELAIEFAKHFGVTLVLKGHETLVADGISLYRNSTGNPGMATAGSGDVLTGVIAGLIGQKLAAADAARLGVYLHGLAGDLARDQLGEHGVTALDILNALPGAFRRCLSL